MTETTIERIGHDPELDRERLLTVREVARLLSVQPRSVWRMASFGELPKRLRLGDKFLRWRGGIR